MTNDNFYCLDFSQATERILDLMDELGFTAPDPVDSDLLRVRITEIMRENIERQGVRTYNVNSD